MILHNSVSNTFHDKSRGKNGSEIFKTICEELGITTEPILGEKTTIIANEKLKNDLKVETS